MNESNHKFRVLVVDDDAGVRRELVYLLEDSGFDVASACHGLQALQHLGTIPFDVVVTDVYMPRMDGLDLIIALRRKYPDMRVVAISGGDRRGASDGELQQDSYLRAIQRFSGAKVLYKPFAPNDLLAAICNATPTVAEAQ